MKAAASKKGATSPLKVTEEEIAALAAEATAGNTSRERQRALVVLFETLLHADPKGLDDLISEARDSVLKHAYELRDETAALLTANWKAPNKGGEI